MSGARKRTGQKVISECMICLVIWIALLDFGLPALTFAADPEVEELERQLRELELKQKKEAKRKTHKAARKRVDPPPKDPVPTSKQFDPEQDTVSRIVRALAGEFVLIEPGCFDMGSQPWEEGRDRDELRHRVCITHAFDIGKYEVTQGQWERVMGNNPSYFSKCGLDCPVERVSWDDAQEFIRELNILTGLNYRLPTEAEWEFACRRDHANEKYCGGSNLDRLGWYGMNSEGQTHPVGEKSPNRIGLFDMNGNVWEWVQDWGTSDYYESSPPNDPQGPKSGEHRVHRGGGWDDVPRHLRAANRGYDSPKGRFGDLGFRLARTRY